MDKFCELYLTGLYSVQINYGENFNFNMFV